MSKVIQFGETVEGYSIPVLNEREIRAAAGMLFLLMFTSVMLVILKGDFLLLKYFIHVSLLTICSMKSSIQLKSVIFAWPRLAPTS